MKVTLCFLALVIGCCIAQPPLDISAFNIQILGPTKIGNQVVMDRVVDILLRYDNTCVQEIRDINQRVPFQLLDMLNDASGGQYEMVLSSRQGRTHSQEQVAFYYKPAKMTPIGSYQFDQPRRLDWFERPPYTVRFSTNNRVGTFNYLCIHVRPTDAVNEIDHLTYVYDHVTRHFGGDPNMLLGGDFNADCRYVCISCWERISLRQDPRFYWAIKDYVDTTLAASSCAYDRLVLAGSRLQREYVIGSADAFDYRAYYRMTQEEALAVSDHFPVEMELR